MLNPALVPQRAVARLPRWALWALGLAYVVPGVFGRDPWKNADLTAVAYMLAIVRGEAHWWQPRLEGMVADGGVLPYTVGALAIGLTDGWLAPALAARLPFALLLALTLVLVWRATYQLARTEDAQPLAFAFGGEALPRDYARALADGAVLALIACLGLLQLGHETTPELLHLFAVALFLDGRASLPRRPPWGVTATVTALLVLASSGAPTTAVLLGLGGWWAQQAQAPEGPVRTLASRTLLLSSVLALGMGSLLQTWSWRVAASPDLALGLPKLLLWFTWPAWPLVAWTLITWRHHWRQPHLLVPLSALLVALACSATMGASDRALLLALPPMAVLAAFALPTLRRSVSAAIDWFSVFFFSCAALAIWVIYLAMQTGVPAKPAANVAKLAPGFEASFQTVPLLIALAGTAAWVVLVGWRTGRHLPALWIRLALPAGGVALSWLLLMTLWLPLLDYARSYQPLFTRLSRTLPPDACVRAPALTRTQIAAITVYTRWTLRTQPLGDLQADQGCDWLLTERREHRRDPAPTQIDTPAGWRVVARIQRPADRVETLYVFRRMAPSDQPATAASP